MKIPTKYIKWMRNGLILLVLTAPIAAKYYVDSNMKRMEKGITDDLKRIEMKGKTLADIPKKY
jgi:hypothetical protein